MENDLSEPCELMSAWNNGEHHKSGAGYGIKLNTSFVDKYFSPSWDSIILRLNNIEHKININKSSFKNSTCSELISKEIGKWLLSAEAAPWRKDNPPQIKVQYLKEKTFIATIA